MSVSQSQPGFLVTTSRGLDELLKQELQLCGVGFAHHADIDVSPQRRPLQSLHGHAIA